MRKPKKHYGVWCRRKVESDNFDSDITWEWEYLGDTWAVSPAQAINNIRHRLFGDRMSQYSPIEDGGNYAVSIEFKAELL